MLYIMRHAQTDWNIVHKLQGRTDVSLNDAGRAQAANARERYGGVHFDVCYSSPLVRARETAEIFLNGRNVPIYTDDRLVEMSFGKYEGVENCFEGESPIRNLRFNPARYTPTDGAESFDEMFKRANDFITAVARPAHESGNSVLIVSHGVACMSIMSIIKGTPLDGLWDTLMKNCELVRLW